MNRGVQNTFGEVLLPHEEAIENEYNLYMKTITSVDEYVRRSDLGFQPEDPNKKRFLTLTMTPLCKQGWNELIPGDFSAIVFSVDEGIVKGLVGYVEPEIPLGERGEVTLNCERNALPFPGNYEESGVVPMEVEKVFAKLGSLADKNGCLIEDDVLIFVMKSEIGIVSNCIRWLERKSSAGTWRKFRIISLEILLMTLSQLIGNAEEKKGVIKHEGGAAKFLVHTRYEYNRLLACKWHQKEDNIGKMPYCAFNIGLRRVYNALYYLCCLFGKEFKPCSQVPPKDEEERINHKLRAELRMLYADPSLPKPKEITLRNGNIDTKVIKCGAIGIRRNQTINI